MQESKTSIRTLIVEDEPHMRRYMCEMLAGDNRVVVVGEAFSGSDAVEKIRNLSPDLVFLDIQLPECDGFDIIEKIGLDHMPAVVFVTAYGEYALRAFEVDAIDYLCKPFDHDRLSASVDRAIRFLKLRNSKPSNLTSVTDFKNHWAARIGINEKRGIIFIPVENILWIEAADKYVIIHAIDGKHISRKTIQAIQETLDPKQFVRIHRSVIVRKAVIRGLQPLLHGDYIVKLNDGSELRLSRRFRSSFFKQMSC